MSDSVLDNLLAGVPRGEEIKDSREGRYPDATVSNVELVRNQSGSYSEVVTFGNMRDVDGRAFEHKQRFNIPSQNSHPVVKSLFLTALHGLNLVPRSERQAIYADTDTQREQIHEAFRSVIGNNVPISLKLRKDTGFLDAAILRTKN